MPIRAASSSMSRSSQAARVSRASAASAAAHRTSGGSASSSSQQHHSPRQNRQFHAVVPPSAPRSSNSDEIGFKRQFLAASVAVNGTVAQQQQQNRSCTIRDRGPCARVELMLSARALADRDVFSKSDPVCIVEECVPRSVPGQMQNVFVECGRTERIKNSLNPKWTQSICLDYYFESKQLLRFNIYDIDSESDQLSEHDFLGRCECELADIVAAPNGIHQLRIQDVPNQSGVLTVSAEELDEGQRESVHFVCRAISLKSSLWWACLFQQPNTFLEFNRLLDDGSQQMVHRTEVAERTRNPEWKPFEISVKRLSEGDKEKNFLVECFDRREATGNHHLIGSAQCSVASLVAGSAGDRQLELHKWKHHRGQGGHDHHLDDSALKGSGDLSTNSKSARGVLHFLDVQVRQEHTFLDYITAGLQLEFAVAVDLTASNGEVSKSSSLHYVNTQYLNQYECAIAAVLEICEKYNHSKQFEALGFGAKIPPAFAVSHMFPLRLNNFERTVTGVQGVLDAYRYAVVNTQLYGPTNFAPTIREFVHKCRQQQPRDGSRYQVLLILTDGIITDMQKTMEAIIEASQQPISIIIIGIGNENFSKMEFLDADNRLLTFNGKTAARDIVQFVPFREFTGSAWGTTTEEQAELKKVLAREVLAELPLQVCSYMKANAIAPLARPPPIKQQQQNSQSPPPLPTTTITTPDGRTAQVPSPFVFASSNANASNSNNNSRKNSPMRPSTPTAPFSPTHQQAHPTARRVSSPQPQTGTAPAINQYRAPYPEY